MFGIIRPCRHRLSEGMRTEWMAHLCGLCLALKGDHGQFARIATNYDGLVISVLVEAQSERAGADAWRRTAGPCPLRGMRGASVAQGEGARLAATVSLVLASAKMRDHVADGDGALARRLVAAAARKVAARWDRAGARTGSELGFDTAVLVDAVERQAGIESLAGPGTPLLEVTEPTETATAAAFGYTAVLAGRPGNREALEEAGRLFGRLAHLLDAVEDLAEDARTGAWNPVTATGAELAEVRRLCDDAVHGVRLALREVEFASKAQGKLAHLLLAHELERSVDRAFGTQAAARCGHQGHSGQPHPAGPEGAFGAPPVMPPPAPPEPPRRRRGLIAGCAVWTGLFCTGQVCCKDPYQDPWNGQPREGWCAKCADNCDGCGDGCDCCDCCDCCSKCGDGCDCCDCSCDCGC
ncbi:hypothetical protein BLA24_29135 [Streptomyces cinnamoneus]|uniref:Regulatory protein n=1 Tax=Streptomyces cinnamoneus TaxID=53446 RepID=A0A2G1XB62_STRCJ|nr:DUF5685 family protein [Streptomyces cinnamoneus]PHQ48441.1 hypothetical protein BLA24_29135 [Streptomyces cinnamoneus]PPT12563.1 hypothetical protein CYQ11_06340 [Streptomyces cinnamoneus]